MPIIKHVNKARRRAQNKAADEVRGTARERGYTAAWDRFALNHLKNNPLCVYCLAQDIITPADVVDHVRPHCGDPDLFWPKAGDDVARFFASSCNHCHNGPKQSAERAAAQMGKDIIEVLIRRGMWKKAT